MKYFVFQEHLGTLLLRPFTNIICKTLFLAINFTKLITNLQLQTATAMDDGSKSGQTTSTLPPLPPGWQKIHSDCGPYYWNKESNKTQWKFPAQEGKRSE